MQIKDSVNAANLLSVGMGTAKETSKAGDSDFASFLNSQETNADKNNDSVSAEKELFPERNSRAVNNLQKTEKTDKPQSSPKERNDDTSKTKADDSKAVSNDANTVNDRKTTSGNDNIEGEVEITQTFNVTDDDLPEITEEILEMLGDVMQVVMRQFDMSAEDVQDTLGNMNMDFSDLMTEEGEKTFFLDVNGADVSELLTDDSLRTELSEFISDIKTVTENIDIDPETVAKVLDESIIDLNDVKEIAEQNISVSGKQIDRPVNIESDDEESFDVESDRLVTSENGEVTDKQDLTVKINVNNDKPDNDHSELKDRTPAKKSQNVSNEELQNTVLQGINEAVESIEQMAEVSETSAAQKADIVEQIVEQIRVNINQDNTSLEMQLYPEHLGRIQIHVVSKDGVMTARIAAETEAAKQAIEAGLTNLKESLQNQNLKVDAIEVMVSTTAFAQSNEQKEQYGQQTNNRKNGGGFGFDSDEDEDTIDETDAAKMQAEGSSVSYRA